MNAHRVKFYAANRTATREVDTCTIWVDANGEHHAVAEATMLAMAGTGNADAEKIGEWLRAGMVISVYAVIETN